MSDQNHSEVRRKDGSRLFRRGEWVEVRPLGEIQATLDVEGKLDGMPFMPEMVKYCGRRFRVSRRADRVFLDRYCYVAGLKDTVFLEEKRETAFDLRCDGQAHSGCQMRCELFWKEAWLKPADGPDYRENETPVEQRVPSNLLTRKDDCFVCQATELVRASARLPWWDLRQYLRELRLGETTAGALFVSLLRRACQKVARLFYRQNRQAELQVTQPTPTETLNLQPGEFVEVKSLQEIQATLDANGKNRGLGFAPGQADFCGKRLRVAGRVERLILEWSGEMRPIANAVELEEVTCHGRMCRSCPRNCYYLWREIWLRRLPNS
jgi:hypothetical protein